MILKISILKEWLFKCNADPIHTLKMLTGMFCLYYHPTGSDKTYMLDVNPTDLPPWSA